MIEFFVNGKRSTIVSRGVTRIIDALDAYCGKRIVRYCYSSKLNVIGNCRSCIVNVRGRDKAVLACVEELHDGMEIYTGGALASRGREGVLELMLLNHPLDCPVCDQGGECDLQEGDQSVGSQVSRSYKYRRREVLEKDLSNRLGSKMKRCITCSRCVRYDGEALSNNRLGLLGRSENVEVSLVNRKEVECRLVGNVLDMCPVGLVRY